MGKLAIFDGYRRLSRKRYEAEDYYGTLIGSHGAGSNGIIFDDFETQPNTAFKVTVHLQVEYLKNGVFYGQSY